MLESIGDDFDESTEVPLENVSSDTLKKIVTWIEHSANIPQPTSEEIKEKTADIIDSWDEDFLKMELSELYALVRNLGSVKTSVFIAIPILDYSCKLSQHSRLVVADNP